MALHRTVLFDCDSTLSEIEGIEELAVSHRDQIAELTESAMRGEVPLEAVYGKRLALIRPTRAEVNRVGALYVERLVPDVREVVRGLQSLGVHVRIISGGLRPAVLALAEALGIAGDDVAAVDIHFDSSGSYTGFDDDSPLARAGGKLDVVRSWLPMARPVMLVGDGATDLEALSGVDSFVAYMGVAQRPQVAEGAHTVVRSRSIAPVFALALGRRPHEARFQELYDRGIALLREHQPPSPSHLIT